MEVLAWFIIGSLATWRLTWDLVSCVKTDTGECEPNLEGPFRLYDAIRWTLTRPWMPRYVQEGSTCVFCLSMWAAGFVALLIPSGRESIASWLVWTLGMAAPTAFWLRYVRMLYSIPPREF